MNLADVIEVELLVPKDKDSDPQQVDFHISIPMGYVEFSPFFCVATEMVKSWAINRIHAQGLAPEHPLDTLVESFPQ